MSRPSCFTGNGSEESNSDEDQDEFSKDDGYDQDEFFVNDGWTLIILLFVVCPSWLKVLLHGVKSDLFTPFELINKLPTSSTPLPDNFS